jgi:two-component system chemotaxis response regulator CheY
MMMNCKSILVVEDNQDIREAVAEVLEMEGFSVHTAAHGQEALEKLPLLPDPLILLDMMMPVMNGWEFLEARQLNAVFAEYPVVVVSALPAGKALVPETGLIHAEGLLEKPINLMNLLKIVQTYCDPAVIPAPQPGVRNDARLTQSF